MELVIPFYCGRKNKVTVVYVRFFFFVGCGEKKRNGKKKEKEKERRKKTSVKVLDWPQTTQLHHTLRRLLKKNKKLIKRSHTSC